MLITIFYMLFEIQNGWPVNEPIFLYLQALMGICSVASLLLLSLRSTQIYSAIPLLTSFVVVSVLSRSSLSPAGVVANLVIIISVFFISYLLRKYGVRKKNTSKT